MNRLPDPREKPWLTVAELAEITGEGQKAIRTALDADQLPVLRIGRYVRIPTALLLTQLGIEPTEHDEAPDPLPGPGAQVISSEATKDTTNGHDQPRPRLTSISSA